MKKTDGQILEKWLKDPSFIRWCTDPHSSDFQRWEVWLANNEHRRELAEIGKSIIWGFQIKEREVTPDMSQASLNQVLRKIGMKESLPPKAKVKRLKTPFYLKIAAALLLLVTLSVTYYWQSRDVKVIISTNFGEKMDLVLPDETVVILNANSKLEYNRKNPRDVHVEGEAFFHVKKKPETGAKFYVRTDNLAVEVLGTAFNVSTSAQETEVYLQEGKIKLELESDEVSEIMEPGDLFNYKTQSKPTLTKTKIATNEKTDWTDGNLSLRETLVSVALGKLSKIYGFEYGEIPTELEDKRLGGDIPTTNEKLALEILSKTVGYELVRVENKWVFGSAISSQGQSN